MQTDHRMLSSPVAPLILRLSLPGMAAMIASSLGALLDALLLGRHNPDMAAAVSVSLPLLAAIQTIGFTFGMGAGSHVSRSLGAGDRFSALQAASTAYYAALFLALALCGAALIGISPLMRLLGAKEELLAAAAAYARYVLSSGPLLCASLVLSSLLRAQGKANAYMAAFVSGGALGALLQALLIGRIGIAGSGAAMLAREALTLLILLCAAYRRHTLIRPRLQLFTLHPAIFRQIMRSGLPTLLRQGLMSVSAAMLSRTAAGFGSAALAGMGLAARAISVLSGAIIGFGQGFQPVCGFASGSGRMDRVREGYRFCQRCAAGTLLVLGALLYRFSALLIAPFQPDAQVLYIANGALRAQSIVLAAQGTVVIMNMLTQAMGLTVRASVIACSRQGFVLIPLLLILPRVLGLPGLLLCQSVSDVLSLILCFFLTKPVLKCSSCAPCGCSDARTTSR